MIYLISILLIVSTYAIGKVIFILKFGLHAKAYQLGFSPSLFKVKIKDITISIGLIIPLPFLFKIYELEEEEDYTRKTFPKPIINYRHHPIYQRLLATMGGVLFLLLGSMMIFFGLAYFSPDAYLPIDQVKLEPSKAAQQVGFQRGDVILSINESMDNDFAEVNNPDLLTNKPVFLIQREDQTLILTVSSEDYQELKQSKTFNSEPFLAALMPFTVGQVMTNSPAYRAGLQMGDSILYADTVPINDFQTFKKYLKIKADSSITLKVQHPNTKEIKELALKVNTNGTIGIGINSKFQYRTRQLSVLQASGITQPFKVISKQLSAFKTVFSGSVYETTPTHTLSGPIGIANKFENKKSFWKITGMLMMVALFFEVFPLPNAAILSVIPLIHEAITKKPASNMLISTVRKVFFYILLILFVFIFINDIVQFMF